MTIYDITLSVSNDTPVWQGDTPVEIIRNMDMQNGDMYTLSRITATAHAGTHLDAPMHFIKDGFGVDKIDLEKLIGPCFVVDLTSADVIDSLVLGKANIPDYCKRLLCKTKNSEYWQKGDNTFHKDFVGIDSSGAEWIVKRGIRLIGTDYLSVGAYKDTVSPHKILLSNNIVPVEAVDLSDIEQGEYQLVCLPLKLKDCDGAPVRAVLISNE